MAQQTDLSMFLLCYYVYVFLGYYQCHSWPYNPVHTCFHVYVITFYMYVFMCENKADDNGDKLAIRPNTSILQAHE